MKRLVAVGMALVVLVAACGDDDATPAQDDALVAGLTEQILADGNAPGDVAFTEENAACFASGLIDEFGGEKMVAAMDMEFEQFMTQASATERRQVIDVMLTCIDFGSLLTAEFATAISVDSSKCLADAFVGSEVFRDALANSFDTPTADPFDDPAVAAELLPAMFECLSAEELVQLGNQ